MGKAQRCFDVLGLSAFVTTCKKDDQRLPSFFEVHPVTRPIIDSQFRYAFTDRLDIAWVTRSQSFDPCLNARSCFDVA